MFRHEIKSRPKGSGLNQFLYITRQGKHAPLGGAIHVESANMPDCAPDPIDLFRAADKYERKNGSVCREHIVTLPLGLSDQQYIETAQELGKQLLGPRPYVFAVHVNESSLEKVENPHVHYLASDRAPDGESRSLEQHFARAHPTRPELGGCRKLSGGMKPIEIREQAKRQRKVTEVVLNKKLAEYGRSDRVDARSLKEQGSSKEPERPLGKARIAMMSVSEKSAYVQARHEYPAK